jgi:hypothetical protein
VRVFISYRRDDSAGHTGRLYDSLEARFGGDNLFHDHSDIDSGQNFVSVIQEAIQSSDVLLAVIGRQWLTSAANGSRRLDDPADLVRIEILTALERSIPVVPVLVNKAAPVPAAALPAPLQPLATLDAHELTDERWTYDVERLIGAMEKLAPGPARRPSRRSLLAAAVGAVAIPLAAVILWSRLGPASPAAAPPIELAGEWSAEVAYEWGARYTERFALRVDGNDVMGTASFLGLPRGIVAGVRDGDRISFETKTQEVGGDPAAPRDVRHRYRGRIEGQTIVFSMQSEGGSSQVPVEFTARRGGEPGASR